MRADRLLSLLFLLQSHGRMTARDLAGRLEVSERTVYRDIEALGMSGVPVYAERGPGGGCGLIDGYRTNVTGMTEAEIRTLFVANASGPLKDLGMGQALEVALLKLLAALPPPRREMAARARQRVYVDAAGWNRTEEPIPYLPVLQDALWQDRRVALVYRHGDPPPTTRLVDPYGLVAKASIWYLVGAQGDGELRTFRVSRVQHAALTEDTFVRPAEFDLPTYWEQSSANYIANWDTFAVTIRFATDFLPVIVMVFGERINQQIRQAVPDAAGRLTITILFESFEVACSRMLSLGARAEVIAPPELRVAIHRAAATMAEFYAT